MLIDDFGRQQVRPRDLLNRWIIPLESRIDYLNLHNGRKLEIPFDGWVIFSSFNPLNLIWITKLLPQAAIGLLAWKGFQGFFARLAMGKLVSDKIIHIHKEDAYNSYIHRQHETGRRVHVSTVNEQHEMRRLFSQKIVGIFTDDPFLARQTLEVH